MTTIHSALLVAAMLGVSSTARAQVTDSLRAHSAFQRQDWRLAASLYDSIARRSPTQGLAWMRLGIARHERNDLDGAAIAFERALSLRYQVPTAMFRLARIHGAQGNADRALVYLDSLAPMRAVAIPVLDTLSELRSVRADPRYRNIIARMTALRFPCATTARAREFDFWIGDWDVTPWRSPPGPNAPRLGTNRVETLLRECMLLENWTDSQGGTGKSMNFFDINRQKWRQIWVADGGTSLDYEGELRDGAMRFEGWTMSPGGARILQKLTFFPIHADTVRQLFETSADSGRTWQPGFDGRYARQRR